MSAKFEAPLPLDAPLHSPKISDVVDGNYEAGFYKSVSALQVTACQQNFSSHPATTSPLPPKNLKNCKSSYTTCWEKYTSHEVGDTLIIFLWISLKIDLFIHVTIFCALIF